MLIAVSIEFGLIILISGSLLEISEEILVNKTFLWTAETDLSKYFFVDTFRLSCNECTVVTVWWDTLVDDVVLQMISATAALNKGAIVDNICWQLFSTTWLPQFTPSFTFSGAEFLGRSSFITIIGDFLLFFSLTACIISGLTTFFLDLIRFELLFSKVLLTLINSLLGTITCTFLFCNETGVSNEGAFATEKLSEIWCPFFLLFLTEFLV